MSWKQKVLIFSPKKSPRLNYAATTVLQQHLGLSVKWTDDATFFEASTLAKINYSHLSFATPNLHIYPHNLLFETNVRPPELVVHKTKGLPCFFRPHTTDTQAFFCDVFALVFFLLSRYEEYLPFEADTHGRFPARVSLAYRHGFLERPLADLWVQRLGDALLNMFPFLVFNKPKYRACFTYDIDIAWAYRHRSWPRTIGAWGRDFFYDKKSWRLRWDTYRERIKDPFDTYDYLLDLHQKHETKAYFFFLLGKYGRYDKNISPRNGILQQLIRRLAQKHSVGIHPSYGANISGFQQHKEVQTLAHILQKPVKTSRQHFIKVHLPHTYRQLLHLGVEHDYSMGYPEAVGFRAGTAHPFRWFDLNQNEVTNLLVHPFQVMDVTLKQYLNLSPEQATEVIEALIQACVAVGGVFCPIWHNSSLSVLGDWHEWRPVLETMLEKALS